MQDEKVLTILREEAEREAKARREKTRLLHEPREPEVETASDARKRAPSRKKEPEPAPPPLSAAQPEPAVLPEPVAPPEPPPEPRPPVRAERMPEVEPEIELRIAARRDLLPDVEEIKSTLQPSELPEPEFATGSHGEADQSDRNGAFRAGFLMVISVAILAASVYTASAWLAAKVPALAGPLASYVSIVDEFRLQLDGLMRQATLLISGDKG